MVENKSLLCFVENTKSSGVYLNCCVCIAVGIYRISENVSIFKFYQNIHDILLTLTEQKIKSKIELQRC